MPEWITQVLQTGAAGALLVAIWLFLKFLAEVLKFLAEERQSRADLAVQLQAQYAVDAARTAQALEKSAEQQGAVAVALTNMVQENAQWRALTERYLSREEVRNATQ